MTMTLFVLLFSDPYGPGEFPSGFEKVGHFLITLWNPWTILIIGGFWIFILYRKLQKQQAFAKKLSKGKHSEWEADEILPLIEKQHHSFWVVGFFFLFKSSETEELRRQVKQGNIHYILAFLYSILSYCKDEIFRSIFWATLNKHLGGNWLENAIVVFTTKTANSPIEPYLKLKDVEILLSENSLIERYPEMRGFITLSMNPARKRIISTIEESTNKFLSGGSDMLVVMHMTVPRIYDKLIPFLDNESDLSPSCIKIIREAAEREMSVHLQKMKDTETKTISNTEAPPAS